MANGVSFYYTIQDSKGQTSTVEIPFLYTSLTAVTVTILNAAIAAWGELIDPLVNGGLKSAGVKIEVDIATFGATAALVADVQEKAEFIFRTDGGWIKRLNLPTFIEDFFFPGTSNVDTTDTDVAAFITAMEDGITVSAVDFEPTDTRGDDITEVVTATENWGKRRRR